MYNRKEQVIYIGKAKNLKNRLKSYFQHTKQVDLKTSALVKEIDNIEITVTKNEVEALLLENKLINQLKPKYNIIFRDDKSYPYIALTNEEYPSIRYIRNKDSGNNKKQLYTLYGPYPNVNAVKTSLDLLAKIFKLRTCTSSFFNNRTRPCLEYQLKRCLAPCVGLINASLYKQEVDKVKLFLQNKSVNLIKILNLQMRQEATLKNYETAAYLRDQIKALSLLQNKQAVLNKTKVNIDVLGIAASDKLICIHLLHVRNGNILYTKQFFSKKNIFNVNNTESEFLGEFMLRHYIKESTHDEIVEILIPIDMLSDVSAVSQAIGIKIVGAKKGNRLSWQQIAHNSAKEALLTRAKEVTVYTEGFKQLTSLLGKELLIKRISCFDISHTCGKETVAACVVFNSLGAEKVNYRLFNIANAAGDDYQALRDSITRYIRRILSDLDPAPDIIIVDGGKGQLSIAEQVINNFKVDLFNKHLSISLLSVAKGLARKFGLEKIYLTSNGSELTLPFHHPVFKLLLKIRDEAHRFAIKAHRNKRDKI